MSSPFLNITTATAGLTSTKRGDYNLEKCDVGVFAKASGVSTGFHRGYALTRNNLVTPNVFAVTSGKSSEMVVVSGLPLSYIMTNVNVSGIAGGALPTDGTGEDVCANDDDVAFTGVIEGPVVVYISGSVQPGQQVMTAANGQFTAYDGSGIQFVKGYLIGAPGQVEDARQIKQAVNNGLGVIYLDGDG